MKLNEIKEKLAAVADTVGKNKAGNFVARREYFYRHGQSSETFEAAVKAALPGIKVIRSWDHFARFSGGASTAKSSHFGVEFTF